MDAITRAFQAAGNAARLAKFLGLTPQAVGLWRTNLVPPARCPAIEAATGVTCEELRPDLQWERDDSGAVTGYRVPLRPAAGKAEARAA